MCICLVGTMNLQLVYRKHVLQHIENKYSRIIHGYTDASFLGREKGLENAISSMMAVSTTETEHMTLFEATSEFPNLKWYSENGGISIDETGISHFYLKRGGHMVLLVIIIQSCYFKVK